MHRLVACDQCHRQYNADELRPGDRFRCACGEAVTLKDVKAHDADVVRCSACGGARREGADACSFCGSDFTIHEKDLDTVCPECFARISNHASFCHACGAEIKPSGDVGTAGERDCPACEEKRPLFDRRIGHKQVPILECHSCAGFWLDGGDFRALARAAQERSLPPELSAAPTATKSFQLHQPGERMYRRCPVCENWMQRKNFGAASGVVVDICGLHGVWFDEGELPSLLRWVREGGELRERERRAEEEKRRQREPSYHQKAIDRMARSGSPSHPVGKGFTSSPLEGIGSSFSGEVAMEGLFRVFDSLFDKLTD